MRTQSHSQNHPPKPMLGFVLFTSQSVTRRHRGMEPRSSLKLPAFGAPLNQKIFLQDLGNLGQRSVALKTLFNTL